MRFQPLLVVPLALLAACGSSGSSSSQSTSAAASTTSAHEGTNRIATQKVAGGIGAVLTTGHGRTLYVYLPEEGGKVKCAGGCAVMWPPLLAPSGEKPAASSAVNPTLIGTIANPSGGSIVTYAGWPLHTYVSDPTHGSYNGQGHGGQWYMISPSGKVITKPIDTAASGSSSSSGGTGY